MESRTIPWSWYSDPAVLQLERERVFRRTWQYAGRADQVAEPDFDEGDPGVLPLLVGRGLVEGRSAAYVCRGMVCERPVTTCCSCARSVIPSGTRGSTRSGRWMRAGRRN